MRTKPSPRPEWKSVWVRLPWLMLIPLGLLIPRLCAGHAAQIETYYSSDLYRVVKGLISRATSLFSFSLAEWMLYAVIAASALTLVISALRVILRRAHISRLLRHIASIGVMAGAILCLFYATWGLNYFRTPLKTRMGLTVEPRPLAQLETLAYALSERANTLRVDLPEDENGVATLEEGYRAVLDALPEAYDALSKEQPLFSGRVTRAKSVFWSKGLSWAGITGVYVGITAEPNVNADAPIFALPQVAAHEMAHELGIAFENEAEFVSYLACNKSNDPAVQYSGVLSALIRCGNALYAQDEARYAALYETYCEGVRRDLAFSRTYWRAYEGKTEERVTQINDGYLKHNQQESGVQSYGEAVDLLLAYYALTNFELQ